MSTSTLSGVSTVIVVTHGLGGQANRQASGAGDHGRAVEVHRNWLRLEEHVGPRRVPRWTHRYAEDIGQTPEGTPTTKWRLTLSSTMSSRATWHWRCAPWAPHQHQEGVGEAHGGSNQHNQQQPQCVLVTSFITSFSLLPIYVSCIMCHIWAYLWVALTLYIKWTWLTFSR